MPLRIFRLKALRVANGIAITVGASLFGVYFFLSLYLQQVNDYSPLKGGLAFLPAGLATLIGSLAGTKLVNSIGVRRQLVLGPLLALIGLAWLSTLSAGDSYFLHVFGPLSLFGFGMGLTFVPMTLAATTGVAPQEAGLASGLINTARQIGGAVGLAAMATIAASAASHHGIGPHAIDVALTRGYDRAFMICAAALFIGVLLALTLPTPRCRQAGTVNRRAPRAAGMMRLRF